MDPLDADYTPRYVRLARLLRGQTMNNRIHMNRPDAPRESGVADDYTRKRLLAIDVLLEAPEEISDGLEVELYALRDTLQALALSEP